MNTLVTWLFVSTCLGHVVVDRVVDGQVTLDSGAVVEAPAGVREGDVLCLPSLRPDPVATARARARAGIRLEALRQRS